MNDKLPSPDALLLHRIRWDYFVTLTHALQGSPLVNPKIRIQSKRWHKYVRIICRTLKQHPRNVLWIKRWEVGRGGREHFHFLFNLHNERLVCKATKYLLKHIWESKCGYGIASARAVRRMGVQAYITKLQNNYELNRFGAERFRHVEFSKSALKTLRRLLQQESVHAGLTDKQLVAA